MINHGSISVAAGGSAVLAGARVVNDGLIEAQLGKVALAGADTFTVDFTGDKLISFAIDAGVSQTPIGRDGNPAAALVANAGTIRADGGEVLLTARAARSVVTHAINTTGMIEATSAHEENGEIVLDAGDGPVNISGTLDVSGKMAGATGGTIEATGGSVTVNAGAVIDASGDQGGGSVALGGDLHGAGPLADATTTTVAAGAFIDASAITNGNGGTVAVWSNGTTLFDGSILAKGGAEGGNGGMVETSGAGGLVVGAAAAVTTSAVAGTGGTWLLDPILGTYSNVTITNATSGVTCSGSGTVTCAPTSNGSTIDAGTIDAALDTGETVIVSTSNGSGGEAGTITVSSPIQPTGAASSSLDLNANSNILVNAAIGALGGPLNVTLASAAGSVTVNAQVSTNGGSFIASGTGITIGAQIIAGAVSLTAGTGSIAVNSAITASGAVTMDSSADITIVAPITTSGAAINLTANSSLGGTPAGNGAIALSANVSTAGNNQNLGAINLTVSGGTGALDLNGNAITQGGAITVNAPIVVTANSNVNSTNNFAYAAGAAVTFNGTIDDKLATLDELFVTSGDGALTFNGAVGGTAALGFLGANGGGNSVTTNGLTINAPMTLAGGGGFFQSNRDVTINAAVAGTGTASLNINAGDSDSTNTTTEPDQVLFGAAGSINFAGSTGAITINYHPTTFPTPTNFSGKVTGGSGGFVAYMNIRTVADLEAVVSNLAGDYALGGSQLDLSSVPNFTPIGTAAAPFTGIFNGEFKTIANLTISASTANVGLFGVIGSTGKVENLGLVNANVAATGSGIGTGDCTGSFQIACLGALAGRNDGTISKSYVAGMSSVTAPAIIEAHAGGLVGQNNGTITLSYAAATVRNDTGAADAGGLAGDNFGTVNQSYATGPASSAGLNAFVGGLVGYGPGTVTQSFATGLVTATGGSSASGGLIGSGTGTTSVTQSYWDQDTTGKTTSFGGGTAVHTAGLQAALPSGFSSSVWGVLPNPTPSYPYFLWQYGSQPQVVSGFATTTALGAAVVGGTIAGQVNGTGFGEVTTGANGYYYFLLAPVTISAGSGQVIVSIAAGGPSASSLQDNAAGSVAGLNVTGGALRLTSVGASVTGILGDLATAVGAGGPGIFFTLGAGNVPNLPVGDRLTFAAAGAALTVDEALTLPTTNVSFVPTSTGLAVTQSQPLSVAGLFVSGTSATYTLTNTGNSFPQFVAGSGAPAPSNVTVYDSASVAIGTVGPSSGATLAGNLTLTSAGSITINNPVTATGIAHGVTLIAGNNVTVNAAVTTQGSAITIEANTLAGGLPSGSGSIVLNALLNTSPNSQGFGPVTLTVAGGSGSFTAASGAAAANTGSITTDGGTVTITAPVFLGTSGAVAPTISTAGLNNATSNGSIVLQAAQSSGIPFASLTSNGEMISVASSGTLTIASPLTIAAQAPNPSQATLSAGTNLAINAAVTSTQANGTLQLEADGNNLETGTVTFGGGATVSTASGGNITIYYHPLDYPIGTSFTGLSLPGSGATTTALMTVDSAADLQAISKNLTGYVPGSATPVNYVAGYSLNNELERQRHRQFHADRHGERALHRTVRRQL